MPATIQNITMKKIIVALSMACLLPACMLAQQASLSTAANRSLALHTGPTVNNNIHSRAMRDFLRRNKIVTNPSWYTVDNGYVVKYLDNNDNACRTVYNNRGEFVYTLKQYNEKHMGQEIRKLVKREYFDYNITLVEEIQVPSKPVVYVVHLQDEATLKNLRIADGEIEVISDHVRHLY
jgi:hypothetical protein